LKLQIKIEGKTYEAEVEVLEEEENEHLPSYVPYPPNPVTPQPAPGVYTLPRAADRPSTDERLYLSPLAGLVIKVNVTPGEEIQPNDIIMVLEAMKMETNITARHGGRVKSVNVAAGDPVKVHQVLVELE
jgi:methylmalonyl-CoA carboxyltransferase 1.3S subunit